MIRRVNPKIILALVALSGVLTSSIGRAATEAEAQAEFGDAWADLGNWNRAVAYYQKALDLDPALHPARLRLAEGLHRLGRSKGAMAQLARLEGEKGHHREAACIAGRIQLDRNQPASACRYFDEILSSNPEHGRALFGSGQCHRDLFLSKASQKDRDLARNRYQAYLNKHPTGPWALGAKEGLSQITLGTIGVMLDRAKKSYARGEHKAAEKLLRKVLAKKPGLEKAHYLMGMTLASPKFNRLDEARSHWEKAPGSKHARLQLGVLAFEEDYLEQARDWLVSAIDLDPDFPDPYYHLGLVYLELQTFVDQDSGGARAKAIASFQRITELTPDSVLAKRAASKLKVLTGDPRYLTGSEVIDTATEVELGRRLTSQVESRFGTVQDKRLQVRLDRILRRLGANSDRLPGSLHNRVKVLKVDGINALSFTGGTIYLYKGLVDFIRKHLNDSDDAYAVVLGHELVHLDRRHGLDLMDVANDGNSLRDLAKRGHALNVVGLNKLMQGLGRRHEFEADLIGSLYAYRAGFDPAAAYRFHRKMIATGNEVREDLDHPTHGERAAQLKEYLLGLRAKARQFDLGLRELEDQNFDLAIRHLEIYLGLFPGSTAARNNLAVAMHRRALQIADEDRGYKLTTDIDPHKRIPSIRLRSTPKTDQPAFRVDRILMHEAVGLFRTTAAREPKYVLARVNLGASLLALGEHDEAVRIFECVLSEKVASAAARTNLAVALLLKGDTARGTALLEEVLAADATHPDAHFNMARVLQKAGDKAKAREHFQAYLKADNKSGWAAQARLAVEALK